MVDALAAAGITTMYAGLIVLLFNPDMGLWMEVIGFFMYTIALAID